MRRQVVGQPSDGFGREAPLSTRSLLAEADGVLDREYALHLHVLANVTRSARNMTGEALALAQVDTAQSGLLGGDAALRQRLLVSLAASLAEHAGIARLALYEETFLREAIELYDGTSGRHGLGAYGIERALGSIISARAKVGWSTFGHTGEDVKLHAYGVGAERFRGVLENAQLGQRLASLLGFDLGATTRRLGTPIFADEDLTGDAAAYARWVPPPPGPAPSRRA
jgi:hypothetical protein